MNDFEEMNKPQMFRIDNNNCIVGIANNGEGVEVFADITYPLLTEEGYAKYKLVEGEAVERTPEEIEYDRTHQPIPAPTREEQMQADIDYILMMID